jgi:hypothetical protein
MTLPPRYSRLLWFAVAAIVGAACADSDTVAPDDTAPAQTVVTQRGITQAATVTEPTLPVEVPSTAVPARKFGGYPDAPVATESSLVARFGISGPRRVDAAGAPTDAEDGSGCVPDGPALSDGVWLVRLEQVDTDANGSLLLGVDPMCRYTGANALTRFPDVDFEDEYVTNEDTAVHEASVASEALFFPGYCWIVPSGDLDTNPGFSAPPILVAMTTDEDPFQGSYLDGLPLWIEIVDGEIVEILDGFYSCAG